MLQIVFILCCFFLNVSQTFASNTEQCTTHHCIAVVDAGSSGSRVHIYAYDLDETNTPNKIQEIWTKKVNPGISSLNLDSTTIDNYLNNLFADATNKNIPVYFYATGGMRILPSHQQNKIHQKIEAWFAQHSEWQLKASKTITGHEEALFDWLSVNYRLGTLNNPTGKTVGVLDFGGASVQIVFPVKSPMMSNYKSSLDTITLYGQEYTVYHHSFLGLGQNEMSHQFLNFPPCFADNYPLPDGGKGHGNAMNCMNHVSLLMNTIHQVRRKVQPMLNHNHVESWYAIGAINNVVSNKSFHFENNQFTNQSLLQQAESEFCNKPWDILNTQFPNDDYLYLNCLLPSYYSALMVKGYGLSPEENINLIANVDWSLGAVLRPLPMM